MTDATTDVYDQQHQTYVKFMRLSKWAIGCLAVLVICLYFIVQP